MLEGLPDTEEKWGTQLKNKIAINMGLSIITLNVNGIHVPIKIHRYSWMNKETRPVYMLSTSNPP